MAKQDPMTKAPPKANVRGEKATVGSITPTVEQIPIADLKPHPRNYRQHPADQIEHIKASITDHGLYRNVVIARDGTILAGHGVVLASREMGLKTVPVIRVDLDPDDPKAIKILTGDNGISHLGEVDDRLLTELLKGLQETAGGLLGTGYDDAMLANLIFVTRPQSVPSTAGALVTGSAPAAERSFGHSFSLGSIRCFLGLIELCPSSKLSPSAVSKRESAENKGVERAVPQEQS